MNKPIGPDLYRCSKCNDLTGMSDGPCGRCAMSHPAPQPTTVTKCALCDLAFTSRPDGFVDEDLEREAADHHAVCPKHPIAVGDRVRIVETTTTRLHGSCGEVLEVDRDCGMPYRVKVDGDCYDDGWWCYKVDRIPRPAEVHGFSPGERVPACAPGCQCGAHAPPAPAPALVDGLDREQCLARWMENRLAVESGAAPPHAMTRMQRDVGRAMWLADTGAKWSAELSYRVAADREAERNRVRVEVQDVD